MDKKEKPEEEPKEAKAEKPEKPIAEVPKTREKPAHSKTPVKNKRTFITAVVLFILLTAFFIYLLFKEKLF